MPQVVVAVPCWIIQARAKYTAGIIVVSEYGVFRNEREVEPTGL